MIWDIGSLERNVVKMTLASLIYAMDYMEMNCTKVSVFFFFLEQKKFGGQT